MKNTRSYAMFGAASPLSHMGLYNRALGPKSTLGLEVSKTLIVSSIVPLLLRTAIVHSREYRTCTA